MRAANNDRVVILFSLSGIALIGVACLLWPRQLQKVSIWWADFGLYPFTNFARSEAYVVALRIFGLLLIAVACFLMSGFAADLLRIL